MTFGMLMSGPVTFPLPQLRQTAPFLAKLWLSLPHRLRLGVYYVYRRFWRRRSTKANFGPRAFNLGLGLYLKCSLMMRSAEPHAMWLVQQHTNVTSPKLLDYIVHHTPYGDYSYILMTAIPGEMLCDVADTLTTEEVNDIGISLRRQIEEFRSIPNPYSTEICSAAGGETYAPHFCDAVEIPAMQNMAAFHQWIRKMARRYWPQMQPKLEPTFAKFDNTKPVFSHGDIADHNIMIHKGKFSGLIDWETAGWMPVYWEYTCSLETQWRSSAVFMRIIGLALPDKYPEEKDGISHTGMILMGIPPKV
ncbi:hypothetical protein CALCODRAFT_447996 [Calocera cornea HHB12733]|uniref:Aminoglycoside phosphotransferase domain-containing protein n=1 Tax=Calocera cornea HHB12733 TaxID=1353952 RepID=A0A165IRC5_9BASI|nr:hypothetical protein CALCODRAFT_447996 [Calocera cornea HHB12733]